jgi:hypothetical protein
VLAVLLVLVVGVPLPAAGTPPEDRIRELEEALSDQRREIAEQKLSLDEKRRLLERQSRQLEEQQRTLEALRREVRGEAPAPEAQQPLATQPAAEDVPVPRPPTPRAPTSLPEPAATASGDTAPPPSTPTPPSESPETPAAASVGDGDEEAPEPSPDAEALAEAERPKSERPIDQLLVEAGGILLPHGALQVEPGFEWSHFSDSAVAIAGLQIFGAILIGTISVDRLDRDIWSEAITARYGLFRRFQLETRVPFVIRHDSEVIGVGTADEFERDATNYNIGDMEVAALWQPILARRWIPDMVLNVRARFPTGEDPFGIRQEQFRDEETGETVIRLAKPPTGSGFYGISPGFTTVWRSDPAVLFFGGNYTVNIPRSFGGGFGKIDPGDQLSFFAGINVALSERLSLNLSFSDTQTFDSKQGGRKTSGSSFNDARIVLGTSLNVGNTSLLLAAVAGLTAQSPDVQVVVRLPLTWRFDPLVSNSIWDWMAD